MAHAAMNMPVGMVGSDEYDEARAWTRKAWQECRRHQDHTGVEVYAANLKEIDRAAAGV
ncbi:hypothetical protein AB0E78_22440 [Streptomyces sp. NPDC032198]|uniref:hypothetical protein n=1 Tax=unclassified Streptomyces TaxID=2593676 RepID=UPI0033EC1B12